MSDFNTDDINDLILKDIAIEECKERIAELEAKNAELLLKLTKALKKVADLNVRQKRLVEIILSEVEYYQPNGEYMSETEAFYFDAVVYGLEKAAAIVKAALKEKDDA